MNNDIKEDLYKSALILEECEELNYEMEIWEQEFGRDGLEEI